MKIEWKTQERDYGAVFGICGRLVGQQHGNLRAGVTFSNWLRKNNIEKQQAILKAKSEIKRWLLTGDMNCVLGNNMLEGNEISGDEWT